MVKKIGVFERSDYEERDNSYKITKQWKYVCKMCTYCPRKNKLSREYLRSLDM